MYNSKKRENSVAFKFLGERQLMFDEIMRFAVKPPLYAPSTRKFWGDEHISKGMLEAHLNPKRDAATRNHAFIDLSVLWIVKIAPPKEFPRLLDLGCGPGLYAERFYKAGYAVTGVDFSERSVAYAKARAAENNSIIDYRYQNYLTIDERDRFDLITLIYCDYAALSAADRSALLAIIFQALKPGGKFILDVFTPRMRNAESSSWYSAENGGFFSPKPHLCLESHWQYDDADSTEVRQITVITEDSVECYRIWDHFFSSEALIAEIMPAGFSAFEIFGDVAGAAFSETSETVCGVFVK
jgi:SAM-dependent methyltransferase